MPQWLKRLIEEVVLDVLAKLLKHAQPTVEIPPADPADSVAQLRRTRAIAAAMFRPGR